MSVYWVISLPINNPSKKKVNKHMRKLIPSAYYHIKQAGKYATNYW